MKTILSTILFIALTTASFAQVKSNAKADKEDISYIEISKEKFAEIEAKMNKQPFWSPIKIEGYKKAELVAFYMQSYNEKTISTWVDFAYKKMQKFEKSKPTKEQIIEFEKIIKLPRTKENAFNFMMLMTKIQIETVGY